jgi:hypothetical protein
MDVQFHSQMNMNLKKLSEKLGIMKFDPIPVMEVAGKPHQLDWSIQNKPDFAGVYAFWWKHGRDHLWKTIQNRTVAFYGVGGENGKLELLKITKEHFTEFDGRVPLYIGKSVRIAPRIGQHLLLKTKRAVPLNKGADKSKRKTSSCQMRDRMDRLLHHEEDTRDIILKNLALSFVQVDDWVDRFFLEDLAIGLYRPLFNLDCER